YLGHIYPTDVRLPMTLRHFGPVADGGAGEAYHAGIFGMTGSGKSVLAAYLIAAQLRHPQMGILVVDPQGQFASETDLPFSLQEWAERLGRDVHVYRIATDLQLRTNAPLLCELLENTRFFRDILTVRHEANRESAVSEFVQALRGATHWEQQEPGE